MLRRLTMLAALCVVGLACVLGVYKQTSFARMHPIAPCVDIPAARNYLVTRRPQDAITSINRAHQIEHLPALKLPRDFYQLDAVQQQFILLNQERTVRGLQPLTLDKNLSVMAKNYSQQMSAMGFFAHESPLNGSFENRFDSNNAVANHYQSIAENLAGNPVPGIGPIYEYMYRDSHEACGHRINMLNTDVNIVGIGVINDKKYGSISAQEFLASAYWAPYTGKSDVSGKPAIAIQKDKEMTNHSSTINLQAVTHQKSGVHVSWFVDRLQKPVSTGFTFSLTKSQLSTGKHTIYAYVVDGNQAFAADEVIVTAK